ncbi:deoxynucleoside kinase [Rhizobium leguminosarum]|uniref:deoxynucleoside kinase n=1 Tax=Rhizobium leguminosarum TaxID=384 RepID=UPI001C94066B|nr:deoxynucleoside kinase [Rhizobium leguminosarum]MBY5738158.1 deoxynucleoside kinase [Rhizobium leguminosarum]
MTKFVAVTGGIAVGKTTLGQALAERLPGAVFIRENPEQNPFLDDFYADRARWAFHSRIGMLDLFERRMEGVLSDAKIVVLDRTVHELTVFADLQLKKGTMTQKEYNLYRSVFLTYCQHAPKPDLIVRVTCAREVARERMHKRGRPFERNVTMEYLEEVEAEYDHWFAGQSWEVVNVRSDENVDFEGLCRRLEY